MPVVIFYQQELIIILKREGSRIAMAVGKASFEILLPPRHCFWLKFKNKSNHAEDPCLSSRRNESRVDS